MLFSVVEKVLVDDLTKPLLVNMSFRPRTAMPPIAPVEFFRTHNP